ncbi:hypothetical protein HQ308_15545 [Rhodococcus sp. BP-241]|uniref:hypothetical protein n=1 Tax=unclassified Rhodococcus (in: high G+C Gram-positive bacteria) TaxID=192944 RepID=UPI0006F78094|nr:MULTISPECIES: hypothetical protein [unclassified Rhodococcus (in: high G+C Gram-positive bacteria)]KQU31286.1 hypothetical protein ASG69_03770 [Rhodococcus sp. Leaf225]KQU41542.1 hypothetical protein ASH03_17340 [Rhodococcus sp. Leaf258]MBY6708220.1 hypothetical protein [Rhodococcus sp. BP-241]
MTSNEPESSATEHPDAPRSTFRPGWMSRIPARILGRFRTTTVVMVLAFLAVLVLWNNVRFDPTLNENSPVYVPPAPSSSEAPPPAETYAPTTTTFRSTTTPVPTTTDPASPQDGVTTTAPAPTTTTGTTTRAPGFQLPTIPGLPLPSGTN